MADPKGGAREERPSVKILSFSCSFEETFCKIIGWLSINDIKPPSAAAMKQKPPHPHRSWSCLWEILDPPLRITVSLLVAR